MLQREIGNPEICALPRVGFRLQDFTLPVVDGGVLSLSDFRGTSNVVLVFAEPAEGGSSWLARLARESSELKAHNAVVLVVFRSQPREWREQPGLVALFDADGAVSRAFGAVDSQGRTSPAVFVADRFGEVVALWRTVDGHELPEPAEIVRWLDYVESLCPECDPVEWPRE
jgi:peroxiredoxin